MNLEVLLASRYLSSQKGAGLSLITWIALIGVAVGVMSLIIVMAVMSGFEYELRSKILGNRAHLTVELPRMHYEDGRPAEVIEEAVRGGRDIRSVMPVIQGEAFALTRFGSEGIRIKGVDVERVQEVLDLKDYLRLGDFQGLEDGGLFVGSILAEKLNIQSGDIITVLLNKGDFSPLGLMPRMRRLKVVDIFHSGLTYSDAYEVYSSLPVAAEIFDRAPRTLEVRTTDPRLIAQVRRRLVDEVPEAIFVHDWLADQKELLSALKLEKMAMAIILALIILVAAMNVCGSLIMIVRDKTRDIAILKSMGAEDFSILRIFLYQGVFIGAVGTAAGLILGLVTSLALRDWVRFPLDKSVYMIDTLPVDIRATDVGMVVLGALLISTVATLYPSWIASTIKPAEGLKVQS